MWKTIFNILSHLERFVCRLLLISRFSVSDICRVFAVLWGLNSAVSLILWLFLCVLFDIFYVWNETSNSWILFLQRSGSQRGFWFSKIWFFFSRFKLQNAWDCSSQLGFMESESLRLLFSIRLLRSGKAEMRCLLNPITDFQCNHHLKQIVNQISIAAIQCSVFLCSSIFSSWIHLLFKHTHTLKMKIFNRSMSSQIGFSSFPNSQS